MPENRIPGDDTDRRDPIDQAYVQAEALLDDEARRAARRERMLAVVAREGATQTAPAPVSAPRRPPPIGGWLVAACVAGLSLFVVSQVYTPPIHPAYNGPPAVNSASKAPARDVQVVAPATVPPPEGRGARPSPRPQDQAATSDRDRIGSAPLQVPLVAPAPPPLNIAPVEHPMPPPPAPPPVLAERGAPTATENAPAFAPSSAASDVQPAGKSGVMRFAKPAADLAPDRGASLRAAAAQGRTADVQALLDDGVPVDQPDASGDTALMKSVEADKPAVARLLRQHGASLDRRNDAGDSARDMATAKHDEALDRALGLEP